MCKAEQRRIDDAPFDKKIPPWRRWGPFVSERSWGTVREDYGQEGASWHWLTHDMARSKAYRWGEDGLAGWCDRLQLIVFSLAFWNERDPILKERLFGLNPFEGNHGEDVKELYFYVDATPTFSYLKYLYKYPQQGYPYDELVRENSRRTAEQREFEVFDTSAYDNGRYFDIVVEYAKASPDDTCIRLEIFNRSQEEACLHVLPQLVYRNFWQIEGFQSFKPDITPGPTGADWVSLFAKMAPFPFPDWLEHQYELPPLYLYGEQPATLLFTENETNQERLYGVPNTTPYVKDAFHRYLIQKEACINPLQKGSKAAVHYAALNIPAQSSKVLRLRLTPERLEAPLQEVDAYVTLRQKEADAFYAALQPPSLSPEDRTIQRQALAGLLWNMQLFHYNVKAWLEGDGRESLQEERRYKIRNVHWQHFFAWDVMTMPDKWEFPWFASWDSGFHAAALALVDLPAAKKEVARFFLTRFQHPNGALPAYEWNLSEATPPTQVWALWKIYQREKKLHQKEDLEFLELIFQKLMHNFAWWVNKVDRQGNNFFEGGFLGMDNISIIDRSQPLFHGGYLQQSDGTGWMGFFALCMLRLALKLACHRPLYEHLACVYFEHFAAIADAMRGHGLTRGFSLWDEESGFFYDAICWPDGRHQRLGVRSFVGLIPFFSSDFLDEETLQRFPLFREYFHYRLTKEKDRHHACVTFLEREGSKRYLLSLMSFDQMRHVLRYAFDPEEFLSPFGLRSLSKFHAAHPITIGELSIRYEPSESSSKLKGGNSNWRGPIWLPVNVLFIEALGRMHQALGDKVTLDVGGKPTTFYELANLLRNRLASLFRQNDQGKRPVHGDQELLEKQPFLLFYEHYDAETGRGLGASHQTGWSSLIANILDDLGTLWRF